MALKRAEKQQAELERRQREEQRTAERLKKRGEGSSMKERATVARALLQPNTDIYDFDPKKLTFRQAMEERKCRISLDDGHFRRK